MKTWYCQELSSPLRVKECLNVHGLARTGYFSRLSTLDVRFIEISGLRRTQLSLIENELSNVGGEVCFDRESDTVEDITAVLSATDSQFIIFTEKLSCLPFDLSSMAADLATIMGVTSQPRTWEFGTRSTNFGLTPLIMGILNSTPDSFSDGGKYSTLDNGINYAHQLIEDGADIIDIGGQSTRPGSMPVGEQEEIRRVIPLIEQIRKTSDIPISIDTYYASVAAEALKAGADIINDISACTHDPEMISLAAKTHAGLILMHMQGNQTNMQNSPNYNNATKDIAAFLSQRLDHCVSKGVDKETIVLDPGIGFGKTTAHNAQLISNLDTFRIKGRPVLLGHSRKSFIGNLTDREVNDRDFETLIISALVADRKSADIIRVHDVRGTHRALTFLEKLSCSTK